ncbi:hypothetical protein ES703_43892 [subsurface metagenome]
MIVRFDLETNSRILVKFHHAGVIDKDRYAPLFIEFLGGFEDGLFEHIFKMYGLAID